MEKLEEERLEQINGGASITGSLVNALTDIIKILYEAGHAVGSSIRRVSEGNMCPLD